MKALQVKKLAGRLHRAMKKYRQAIKHTNKRNRTIARVYNVAHKPVGVRKHKARPPGQWKIEKEARSRAHRINMLKARHYVFLVGQPMVHRPLRIPKSQCLEPEAFETDDMLLEEQVEIEGAVSRILEGTCKLGGTYRSQFF
jgi:hypothetical protein